MFDYSRGEPPERFLTALRVLDVRDPLSQSSLNMG